MRDEVLEITVGRGLEWVASVDEQYTAYVRIHRFGADPDSRMTRERPLDAEAIMGHDCFVKQLKLRQELLASR